MSRLTIENITKHYPGFTLNSVSFEVPEGAILGFIGRNGAGKSTTLKSVLGLIHSEGNVYYDGVNVKDSEKLFKENTGVVLGGIDFYSKKKLHNIAQATSKFFPSWSWEKYSHYMKTFGIDESKRVDQLSTGMRVKFLIALALCHDAKLLILDEPTSGLDPVSRDELTALFKAIVKDGTRSILFSTHITSDLEKCASHIAFIKDGEIQFTGTLDAFYEAYKDRGETLEDIIVSVERRELDEGAII